MELDVLLKLLLSFGPPGAVVFIILWLILKVIPKLIDSYQNAKAAERKAIDKLLLYYEAQTEKGIEISASVVSVLQSIEASLANLNNGISEQNKRAEAASKDIAVILENTRRGRE